jgi:hypothetical protein
MFPTSGLQEGQQAHRGGDTVHYLDLSSLAPRDKEAGGKRGAGKDGEERSGLWHEAARHNPPREWGFREGGLGPIHGGNRVGG